VDYGVLVPTLKKESHDQLIDLHVLSPAEITKTARNNPLQKGVHLRTMVVLLNIRAKIPSFELKSAHSSRKLPGLSVHYVTHLIRGHEIRKNFSSCVSPMDGLRLLRLASESAQD
jgi:hypothetical protein